VTFVRTPEGRARNRICDPQKELRRYSQYRPGLLAKASARRGKEACTKDRAKGKSAVVARTKGPVIHEAIEGAGNRGSERGGRQPRFALGDSRPTTGCQTDSECQGAPEGRIQGSPEKVERSCSSLKTLLLL